MSNTRKKLSKIPTEKIAELYEKKAGNLSATARALHVDRNTLMAWRDANPDLKAKMVDVEESMLDFTESKLFQQIDASNLTAIIFYLKTKGRKRGYVERQESDISMHPFLRLMQEVEDEEEKELTNE